MEDHCNITRGSRLNLGDRQSFCQGDGLPGLWPEPKTGRRYPSLADPSHYTAPHKIDNESDLLHIKNLPDLDGVLNQRDSELFLSYLTVPYIRLPIRPPAFFCRGVREPCLMWDGQSQEVGWLSGCWLGHGWPWPAAVPTQKFFWVGPRPNQFQF